MNIKKRILEFVLTICFVFPSVFIFSACKDMDKTTDVAYVQFVSAGDKEVVQYTAYMYADDGSKAHIYLFESEEKKNEEPSFGQRDYLLKISFKRGLGVDYEIDEKDSLVVDIEDWSSMEISIKKEYYYTSQEGSIPKKVYLNGVDITSKAKKDQRTKAPIEKTTSLGSFWQDGIYYFEDFGLVKGNTSDYINTIEFK